MKRVFLYVLTLAAVVFPFQANAQRLLEPVQGIMNKIPINAVVDSGSAEWTQGYYRICLHFKRGIVDNITIYPIEFRKPGIKPDWGLIRQLCPADLNWNNPYEKNVGPDSRSSFFTYHYKWNYLNVKIALTVNCYLNNTADTQKDDLQSVYIWLIRAGS